MQQHARARASKMQAMATTLAAAGGRTAGIGICLFQSSDQTAMDPISQSSAPALPSSAASRALLRRAGGFFRSLSAGGFHAPCSLVEG